MMFREAYALDVARLRELLKRWDDGPVGAEAFAVHAEITAYLLEGRADEPCNWGPLRRLLSSYVEGLEDAEQACRYYLKHNEDRLDNTFPWEEASEYAKGFHIACEGCEAAIRDKREKHATPRPASADATPEQADKTQ